jgi:hypothetical protein
MEKKPNLKTQPMTKKYTIVTEKKNLKSVQSSLIFSKCNMIANKECGVHLAAINQKSIYIEECSLDENF